MDDKTAKEIQELRNRIGDLQLLLYSTLAEVRALTALSTALWDKQNIEMADGKTISEVLQLLKRDCVDGKLAQLADTDMETASWLRRRMDKFLKPQNPQEPNQ